VPVLALFVVVAILMLAMIVLVPFSIIQRYRVGTSRQPARGWLTTINLAGIALSSALFLAGAVVTNFWVPGALTYTVMGLAAGGALGLLGLSVTRWETTPGALYFTPNRLLVLSITLVVAGRILYGFWRGWRTWGATGDASWFAVAGVAGSLAAGAVVLGYYLVYWAGVTGRIRRHRSRP
jgi:hypothetical protein